MAEERIHEEEVGNPPPGSEQSAGPPPGVADRENEPAAELERDPHVGRDTDATNQRVDNVRRALESEPETGASADGAGARPVRGGEFAGTQEDPRASTSPAGERHTARDLEPDDVGAAERGPATMGRGPATVTGQETAPGISPRPYSPQAEDGQHDAAPHERAPYDQVPPFDTLGTRHIEEALSDLVFPMTRAELLARAGNWRIPVTGRSFRTLSEYIARVDNDKFSDAHEVARAVERATKRHRTTHR